ncbi:MAG: hypothetical protein K2Q34_04900 [Alphaproteobacteria bacterium]|nr:hypothetical protein [Alphaproteobacteria bacterium]
MNCEDKKLYQLSVNIAHLFILITLSYFSTLYAAMGTDAGEATDEAEPKMGIEIETSAIKVKLDGEKRIGFIVSKEGRNLWMIEDDTYDHTFEGTGHDRNLECKTIGGFSRESELPQIIDAIKRNLLYFHENSQRAPLVMTPELIKTQLSDEYRVSPKKDGPHSVEVKSKSEDNKVKLQITYQLPLAHIPSVFMRLSNLNHNDIKGFLLALKSSTEPISAEEIAKKTSSTFATDRHDAETYKLRNFFVSHLAGHISKLQPGNLKGFCYLFSFYWYQLFNNKEYLRDQEPGPKQFLGIMSRVPLSQLFDTLSPKDQKHFRSIFDSIIEAVGSDYHIIPYDNYEKRPVFDTLKLDEWYGSLVEEGSRVNVGGRMVDLLSPPPGLEDVDYSMGIMDIHKDSSGLPLLEVRGYANIRQMKERLTFDTFDSFVNDEARWFFGLFAGDDKK